VNIEGKRSGDGFVAHKDELVNALSRAQGERVTLFDDDVTLGRKGFTAYLKALAGSNIVKVVPANGNASGSQVTDKGVKVVCGSHESYLPNGAWLKENLPFTYSQIRVSPCNAVMPNLGSVELAEALSKVLPFTSGDEARPIFQCVRFLQKDGKLTLAGCDGFSLSEVILNFEDGEAEAEALVNRDELKGLISALRKAKRVKVGFEEKPNGDEGLLAKCLVVDTEVVRYKLQSQSGEYPNYQGIIPTECLATASVDAKEAIKASRSLLAVWYDDSLKPLARPIILTIGEGKVVLEAQGDRGQTEIAAETSGQVKVAFQGNRFLKALKACGGIVEMKMVNGSSPVLFTVDSHRCVVMPMAIAETEAEAEPKGEPKAEAEGKPKRKRKGKGKGEAEAEPIAEDEAEAEAQAIAEVEAEAIAETPISEDEARQAVAVA
jgi:DNA polymerase-3 subunit beta